jgi:hypothetical protein
MVKIFSFCIYGEKKKYCQGLIENIKLIQNKYPDFEVHIVCSNNVPNDYVAQYIEYPNVKLNIVPHDGARLMAHRFFPINTEKLEYFFSRDADSRINDRDDWCIKRFMESDKEFHIIRDHIHHGRRIMGGMFGVKGGFINHNISDAYIAWLEETKTTPDRYQADQDFLNDCIYPLVKDVALIHTSFVHFTDEKCSPIVFPSDGTNFVGNVIDYDDDESEVFVFFKPI